MVVAPATGTANYGVKIDVPNLKIAIISEMFPSENPSKNPSENPSENPSVNPSKKPSANPFLFTTNLQGRGAHPSKQARQPKLKKTTILKYCHLILCYC